MEPYRPELPEVPKRMRSLPIRRGYPVPWFVAIVDGDYYFPAVDAKKMREAVKRRLCWCCGQRLGKHLAFVIGPMCCINRITSEPPSHRDCAVFAAQACPFLARPHMSRRDEHPEGAQQPAGIHIDRNPGVALVWLTKKFWLRPMPREGFGAPEQFLFQVGEPTQALWFAHGRTATRVEVLESLNSGYPILHQIAMDNGGNAVTELEQQYQRALTWVPA